MQNRTFSFLPFYTLKAGPKYALTLRSGGAEQAQDDVGQGEELHLAVVRKGLMPSRHLSRLLKGVKN